MWNINQEMFKNLFLNYGVEILALQKFNTTLPKSTGNGKFVCGITISNKFKLISLDILSFQHCVVVVGVPG